MPVISRIQSSLSFKLMSMFLIAAVVLAGVLWVSLGITFERHFDDNVRPHFNKYLRHLQREIGFPPNIQTAQKISEKLPVTIIIESPLQNWSSNNTFLDPKYLELKLQRVDQKGIISEVGFYKGSFVLRVFNQAYITTFIMNEKVKRGPSLIELFITVASTLIIISLLYFIIRRLFLPIHQIEKGVRLIGDGDFSHRLNISRNDEIGSLSQSINKMADNIEQMLEAKRQLLLAISHELRTPLTRAKIALSLMDESGSKESIEEDFSEMEDLIHELLETERLKAGHAPLELEYCDINELIYQVYARYFEKEELTLVLDKDTPLIKLDAKRIGLVIKNLIKNAMTAQKSKATPVKVSATFSLQWLVITVTDTGIGIAQENIEHITEPFYRIDTSRQRKTGGYGIGLYLIKLITEAHSGKLIIQSELNKGTSISIHLPIPN